MMSDEVSVLGSLCTISTRHFSSWHPLQNVTMVPDTSYSPLDVTHRGERSNMFLNCANSGSPYFGSGQGLVKSQRWMSSSARTDTNQSSLAHFHISLSTTQKERHRVVWPGKEWTCFPSYITVRGKRELECKQF